MLTPTFTGSFRKDRKLMEKRNNAINKLMDVLLIDDYPIQTALKLGAAGFSRREEILSL